MINNVMKEYMEKVNNQEQNYNEILSKTKGDGNMKVTLKKILNVAAIFIIIVFVGATTTTLYAKMKWNAEFKEYQNRELAEGKGSIEKASEDGYAEVLDMDYINQDGISAKVNGLLLTDDCFKADIEFKFPEGTEINSETFSYGYAVYDEDKNVYIISERMRSNIKDYKNITQFIYEDIGVKYNKNDIAAIQLCASSTQGIIESNIENKTIISQIEVNAKSNFPKSKKIYIRVFGLGYIMTEFEKAEEGWKYTASEDFTISDAEWIFEIDVPEKLYERDTLELKLAKEIPDLEVTKITLTETALKLNFKSESYSKLVAAGKDMNASDFVEKATNMLNITDRDGNIYQELQNGGSNITNEFEIRIDATINDLAKGLFINYTVNEEKYTSELIE